MSLLPFMTLNGGQMYLLYILHIYSLHSMLNQNKISIFYLLLRFFHRIEKSFSDPLQKNHSFDNNSPKWNWFQIFLQNFPRKKADEYQPHSRLIMGYDGRHTNESWLVVTILDKPLPPYGDGWWFHPKWMWWRQSFECHPSIVVGVAPHGKKTESMMLEAPPKDSQWKQNFTTIELQIPAVREKGETTSKEEVVQKCWV